MKHPIFGDSQLGRLLARSETLNEMLDNEDDYHIKKELKRELKGISEVIVQLFNEEKDKKKNGTQTELNFDI